MKTIRCAIYTRKSSEEGLEQGFNSLDAQREACAAYVMSQAGEGWQALADRYDDGGFSGRTMDRPALKRLLRDVEDGKIDTIVTYKIDRLSRSLADFSRMVELFEEKGVTFVSVTQAFNTTTSMGRLTLNVLLSFAQFEREVTGERIRDKIKASKKKGLFMGGNLPLGYDAPGPDEPQILKVDEEEAETVRFIFRRYLELGSVHALVRELDSRGIRSKSWTSRRGRPVGGKPIGRGALFYLLRNRTYIGMIPHRDDAYPGQHQAIVDGALFQAVQQKLDSQVARSKGRRVTAEAPLKGRITDALGHPMVPTHARGKSGRIYRYYTSAPLTRGGDRHAVGGIVSRIAAPAVEDAISEALKRLSGGRHTYLSTVRQVTVEDGSLRVRVDIPERHLDHRELREDERLLPCPDRTDGALLTVPSEAKTDNGAASVRASRVPASGPDPKIVAALREAHRLLDWQNGRSPTADAAPSDPHRRKLARLALLAPDIQHRLLTAPPPQGVTLAMLRDKDLPLDWQAQRSLLGR